MATAHQPAAQPQAYPTAAAPAYPTAAAAAYPTAAAPGYPTAAAAQPQANQFAWSGEFVSGDWRGAVRAAGIGVAAMLGLAFVTTLLAHTGTTSPGFGELIRRMATLVALAAGGTLKVASRGLGGAEADLSFRPLGLTFLGFSLIAVLSVRRLRQRGTLSLTAVVLQAGRVGLVLLGGLFIVALLSRAGGDTSGTRSTYVDPISTMFVGLITLAIALAVAATLMLPGVLPPRAERYRVLVAAPLRATLMLIVACCAATLVVAGLWTVVTVSDFEELGVMGDFWRSVISAILLMLPNMAVAALLFGIGVPATGSLMFSLGTGGGSAGSVSILDAVGEDPVLLLWPLIALTFVFLTGILSASKSPLGPGDRPVGYWLGIVFPVVLFILGLNLSADASGASMGMTWLSGTAGFDYLFILLLGGIFGLGAGMLGSVIVRGRSGTVAGTPGGTPGVTKPPTYFNPNS